MELWLMLIWAGCTLIASNCAAPMLRTMRFLGRQSFLLTSSSLAIYEYYASSYR